MLDIHNDIWCGRGCQRHDRHIWKLIADLAKGFVVWTEVVAPLTHTVGFVDHNPSKLSLLVQGGEPPDELLVEAEHLRSDIKQLDPVLRLFSGEAVQYFLLGGLEWLLNE